MRIAKYIFIILCLLLILPVESFAASNQYSALLRRVSHWPSAKIVGLADSYVKQGKEGEAIVLYSLVTSRFSDDMTESEKELCVKAQLHAFDVFYQRGNYSNAMEKAVEGVKISEKCSIPTSLPIFYKDIGNIYCVYQDYEKGVSYYLKALDLCKRHPNREVEHDLWVNLAGMYVYLGKLAKAKEAYKQSEKLKNPSDVVDKFMGGYLGGLINSLEGNYSAAVSQFRSLVSYAKEHQLPSYLCFAYQELYHSYNVMEVNDSTLKYMLLCNSTAHRYKLDHIFVETLKDLAFFYEKSGDLEKANRCKSRYIYLNDSIYNLRDFNSVTNTLFTYEVNKATQEIHELKQREEDKTRTIHRQHVTMALVGGGALVLSVLLLIVFRQKRNLDRSYSNLYKLNQTLMESQKDAAKSLRWQNNPSSASLSEIAELKVDNSHSTKYKSGNLSDAQHQFLAKAIEEVMEREEEYCSPDFTLDKLSSLVGSNSTYVSQVINDTFHKSFNNFINTYRIRLACERIADRAHYGNYTLKAIGEGVGFKSYTSFVNIFKDVTGMLPSVYQKMSRKEKPN